MPVGAGDENARPSPAPHPEWDNTIFSPGLEAMGTLCRRRGRESWRQGFTKRRCTDARCESRVQRAAGPGTRVKLNSSWSVCLCSVCENSHRRSLPHSFSLFPSFHTHTHTHIFAHSHTHTHSLSLFLPLCLSLSAPSAPCLALPRSIVSDLVAPLAARLLLPAACSVQCALAPH